MNVAGEFIAQDPGQPLLRGFLRANLRLFFHGLIQQPPPPITIQRGILSALSASCQPFAKRVPRQREYLAAIACEWHKPSSASEDTILLICTAAALYRVRRAGSARCAAHCQSEPICRFVWLISAYRQKPVCLSQWSACHLC